MFNIRLATVADAQQILDIYQHYIIDSAVSFEYDVPSLEEMKNRISAVLTKYPWLVGEVDGAVIGYAYASDFRHRAAYQWSPESSVYFSAANHGKGLAKLLYATLFEVLKLQGFQNVFAGMAIPNEPSERLHRSLGFKEIGTYKNIGFKNGRWHSTKWFQLVLNDYGTSPMPPRPINDVVNTTEFKKIIDNGNSR